MSTHTRKVDLYRFVDAYEAYDGDNVGQFIHLWQEILSGREPDWYCAESADGLHWVTSGSCDECGAVHCQQGDQERLSGPRPNAVSTAAAASSTACRVSVR